MAMVFSAIGPMMLFYLFKDPPKALNNLLTKVSPFSLTFSSILFAYPTSVMIGIITVLLYSGIDSSFHLSGFGSPNIIFSFGVVLLVFTTVSIMAVIFKRVVVGMVVLATIFVLMFGWILPNFVVILAPQPL